MSQTTFAVATAPALAARTSFPRRIAEVAAFIAVWMGLGFALRIDANAYLVLGVPLAIVFQLLVARRPLLAAWVRDAPPLRADARTLAVAAAAALAPAWTLYEAARAHEMAVVAWAVAGIGGALGVGYAVRNVSRARVARLSLASLGSAAPGVAIFALAAVAKHLVAHDPWPSPLMLAKTFGLSFTQYLPICFAIEEVVFRGVLDAHVVRPGDARASRWAAAVLVSAIWGLWHLPMVLGKSEGHGGAIVGLCVSLVVVHVLVGLALTGAWRASGTLLASAVAHALIDATRNALVGT